MSYVCGRTHKNKCVSDNVTILLTNTEAVLEKVFALNFKSIEYYCSCSIQCIIGVRHVLWFFHFHSNGAFRVTSCIDAYIIDKRISNQHILVAAHEKHLVSIFFCAYWQHGMLNYYDGNEHILLEFFMQRNLKITQFQGNLWDNT